MRGEAERQFAWNPPPGDARSPYDVDYSRVIHSASFRRLQAKTQILNLGDSDFYRTRLTHSLEVSQVGTSIVRQLAVENPDHPCQEILPDAALMQSICLTHDLGHPPFGHGGEIALNYCMRSFGGFEANGQTLRILSKLEKFSTDNGANLTRRALLGILKYPVAYHTAHNPNLQPKMMSGLSATEILDRTSSTPPKCYLDSEVDVVKWLLAEFSESDKERFVKLDIPDAKKHRKPLHKTFDCSIMDVADDIGYGVHDFEDAIAMKLLTQEQYINNVPDVVCSDFLDKLRERAPGEFPGNDIYGGFCAALFSDGGNRKRQISRLVGYFLTNIEIEEVAGFEADLLRFRVRIKAKAKPFLDALKGLVWKEVIKSPNVQQLEFKGQQMVVKVFEAMLAEPGALLPRDAYDRYIATSNPRAICDFMAGMTDAYLMRTYERLFSPRMGSVFDRL